MTSDAALDEISDSMRLEELLVERTAEVRALQEEVAHLGRLVHEQARRLETLPVPSPLLAPEQLHASYQAAVNRTLEAEAGRAELAFKLDEALGRLHSVGERDAKQAELHEAHLSGSVRGLRVALADAEEARDIAQARLVLLEDDFQQGQQTIADLRRRLLEAEEEHELLRLREAGSNQVTDLQFRLDEAKRAVVDVRESADAEHRKLHGLLEQVRSDLRVLGESTQQGSDSSRRPSAGLTTAEPSAEGSLSQAGLTGSTPPSPAGSEAPSARLSERLTRSEQLVRTLQGELGRERDERHDERKRSEKALVAQSVTCDALRDELEKQKQQRSQIARTARAMLALVPVGDPLAIQLGDLLASLDA